MTEMRFQPHVLASLMRVGLWRVAEGCVRKKVRNLFLLDKAGELAPKASWNEGGRGNGEECEQMIYLVIGNSTTLVSKIV